MTVEKDDEDRLRMYRSLIRKDIDELEKKLDTIEQKIDKLNQKLEKHIDFIDDTYEGLRNPIKMAARFFNK